MEKAKYISSPFFWILLLSIFIICTFILLILKEYLPALACLCFTMLYLIPFIIFRKLFFRKMLINEIGITTYYRNTILIHLEWKDIQDAQAYSFGQQYQIIFSNKPITQKKEKGNILYEVFVNLNPPFISALYENKNKIPVPIRDINKLDKRYVEMFTKDD